MRERLGEADEKELHIPVREVPLALKDANFQYRIKRYETYQAVRGRRIRSGHEWWRYVKSGYCWLLDALLRLR